MGDGLSVTTATVQSSRVVLKGLVSACSVNPLPRFAIVTLQLSEKRTKNLRWLKSNLFSIQRIAILDDKLIEPISK